MRIPWKGHQFLIDSLYQRLDANEKGVYIKVPML